MAAAGPPSMPCGAEPDEGVDAEHPPGMTKLQRSVSRAAGIRLRTKLYGLTAIFAVALLSSGALTASMVRQRMLDDRIDKLRAVVSVVTELARHLEDRVAAQEIGRDSAIAQLRDELHRIRFGTGSDYVLAQT